jgi:hypothetical protein
MTWKGRYGENFFRKVISCDVTDKKDKPSMLSYEISFVLINTAL